jgi:dTDP-4-amino-4,6-dideoxygalactose transaminase
MSVPFVNLREQYLSLESEINAAVLELLRSTKYILGDYVRTFEEEMQAYCGVEHAIGVNSGTDALLLALKACGIGPGDEVITASNSFFATAEGIVLAGATPVFVDIDPATYLMAPELLEEAITSRTRAIIPVHLYGQCADMDPIMEIANARGLFVIEDACQAVGATYKNRRAGSLGHMACFSFVPAKNLGGYGDGGMVLTHSSELADQVKVYRDHGSRKKYVHEVVGYNSRLDALQAAILSVKLKKLDEWNDNRRNRAHLYTSLLGETGLVTPAEHNLGKHIYHLYVVRTRRRQEFMEFMGSRGLATMIHYPIPIHRQEAFAADRYPELPITERLAPQIVSLPMFPEMTEAQVHEVTDGARAFIETHGPE